MAYFTIHAQKPIILGTEDFIYPRNDSVAVFIDTTNELELTDVMTKSFVPRSQENSYNKKNKATYWYRIIIKNKGLEDNWFIELPDPHTENVTLYKVKNGKIYTMGKTGFNYPFITKSHDHKNFTFSLDSDTASVTYYFKLRSSLKHVGHTILIRSSKNLLSYFLHEYFYLGAYYGIMLIMAVYNLLIFLFTRKKLYFLYVLYVISCGIFSFQEDGLGFQFLWNNHPELNQFLLVVSPLLLMITFVVYSREFLNIKSNTHQRFNYLLFTFIALYIITLSAQYFIKDLPRMAVFYLPPFLAIYIMGIIRYFKEGFKPARFFIVGYSMIIISFFVFLLRINGFIESNLFVVYNFNFGFIFEVVILSFALGERIRHTENENFKANERALAAAQKNERLQKTLIRELKEKEELKDKVNKELEQKVSERTIEITEANEKLKKLTDELNHLNSQLDIDNWNLKKKINKETKARISSENVDYEDFIKFFSSQETCLKHLNEIKWAKGFTCTKCGHHKYISGPRPYTRKCTHCKKIDSVTAQTIFHGVRMPLQKAFYITYITSVKEKGMTVDKLAEILDLRRNTCWAFRKKVEDKMSEYMKTHHIDTIKNWETLILD